MFIIAVKAHINDIYGKFGSNGSFYKEAFSHI